MCLNNYKLRRSQRLWQAAAHSAWFDETLNSFAAALLPVSVEIALAAGALSDRANGLGTNPGYADILIAATAQCHGLTIATRDLRHLEPLGVPGFDPLAGAN